MENKVSKMELYPTVKPNHRTEYTFHFTGKTFVIQIINLTTTNKRYIISDNTYHSLEEFSKNTIFTKDMVNYVFSKIIKKFRIETNKTVINGKHIFVYLKNEK